MLFTRHTLPQRKVESDNADKTTPTETNNTLTVISNWSHQTLMKDTTYSDPASMKLPNSDGFFPQWISWFLSPTFCYPHYHTPLSSLQPLSFYLVPASMHLKFFFLHLSHKFVSGTNIYSSCLHFIVGGSYLSVSSGM